MWQRHHLAPQPTVWTVEASHHMAPKPTPPREGQTMQTQRWVLWQGLRWAAQQIAGWAETHQGAPHHREPGLSRIRVGGCCAGLLLRVCPGVSRLGCLLGLSTSNLGAGGCLAGRHQAALTTKTDLQTDPQMAGRVHTHHGRWCGKLRWHRSEHEQLTPLTYL